jgi:hypothetical protein
MKGLPAILVCALVSNMSVCEAATSVSAPPPTTSYKSAAASVATGMAISLPLLATGITIAKHDRVGAAELLASTILSVGTAYALDTFVREKRPDDESDHSFTPETSALAASSSAFLWGRYGWEYGVPGVAASDFVSFSLTQARKAHWYDTFASSLIATGYGLAVTKRFKSRYNINTRVSAMSGGGLVSLSYEW